MNISRPKNSDALKTPYLQNTESVPTLKLAESRRRYGRIWEEGDERRRVEKMGDEERGEKQREQKGKEKGTLWLSEKVDRENSVHENKV